MRKAVIGIIALALAGCGDVKQTEIDDIDFSDAGSIQKVAQKLEPADREMFARYALNRTVGSAIMPGEEIVRADGKAPKTVAEAIELTKARSAKIDARNKLVDQRNILVSENNEWASERSSLYGLDGRPTNRSRFDELNNLIEQNEAKIADLDKAKKALGFPRDQ